MADTKGVSPIFVNGIPLDALNNALKNSGQALFTAPKTNDDNKFWSSMAALVETPNAEVFEVGLNAPKRINTMSFEVARFPHRGALFYQDSTGTWKPVLSEGGSPLTWLITDSLPSAIPAWGAVGKLVGSTSRPHPQHFGAGHWVKKSWVFRPIEGTRFRVVMSRRVGVRSKPPVDTTPARKPVAYPMGVRHFDIGFVVRDRDDVPLTLRSGTNVAEFETFASTSDLLGSPVDFSLRENRASDLIKGAMWRCEPQPITNAVVNLYADARDPRGNAQVVDRFLIDPITTGVHLNLYYSNQVPDRTQFQASDDPLSFPATRAAGGVGITDTGLLFSGDQSGYVDIDNTAVKFNANKPFWLGMVIQPQFEMTDTSPHVFLDTGALRIEWDGVRLLAALGGAVLVRDDFRFIANQNITLVVSYDGADEFCLYLGGTCDSAIPYDTRNRPTTVDPSIRIGGAVGDDPGISDFRLATLILKAEDPPGMDVYQQFDEMAHDFVVKPTFKADDLSTTDNAILRYDPSLQTPGDGSINPYGFVGGTGDEYALIEWTPINRDFKLHKGYLVFDPVKAKYFKFEFTNLVAQPYDAFTPTTRRVQVFPNYLVGSTVTTKASNNPSSAIPLQASGGGPKYADESRLYLNQAKSAPATTYSPTLAVYSSDAVIAAKLREQSSLYNFQPWQQSPTQPKFAQVGRHVYETVEVKHTSRVAYFVALNSIAMFRVDHATSDDTDQYLELFHDTANLDDTNGLGGWDFVEGGIVIPSQEGLTSATAVSRAFASRRKVTGLQFASQQSPPVQLLPDPDFDDPTMTNWVGWGDASISSSTQYAGDVGTTALVQRDLDQRYWNVVEDTYATWDDIEGIDFDDLQGTPGLRSFGGVASAAGVTVSASGRIYASARVFVSEPLHAPLYVQVVDSGGNVLSQEPMDATPGQVAEWFTSYTIGESGDLVRQDWDDIEAANANWDAVEAKGFWDQVDTTPATLVGELFARVVQVEPTLDSWYMDSLSIYDDSLIWEFSNDGGDTWWPVYDIRNDPHGCFMFPDSRSSLEGRALLWRVTGSRGGQQVNALVIRPLYDSLPLGQPFRDTIQAGGPNVALVDHYPPVTQDARFMLWSKPVPEDWWYGFRQWTLAKGGETPMDDARQSQIVVPEQISEYVADESPRNKNVRLFIPEAIPSPKTTPFYLSETFPVPEEG